MSNPWDPVNTDHWSWGTYDLVEKSYDITFGTSETVRPVRSCHRCGALVLDDERATHDAFHEELSR